MIISEAGDDDTVVADFSSMDVAAAVVRHERLEALAVSLGTPNFGES